MFTKILVAVDGSDHSQRALECACDIANKYGAALHVVHAPQIEVETLTMGSGMTAETMPTRDRLANLGTPIIDRAKSWAGAAGCEPAAVEILLGDTAQSILDYAKRNGIDLIVSGSRGFGNLRGLLQGSVSQKLTAHSTCPVLTVH